MTKHAMGFSQDNLASDDAATFMHLLEQVKLPFMQIAGAAELLKTAAPEQREHMSESIRLASSSAMSLIDSYLLGVELGRQQELVLEPVSLSSVMYDVSQSLEGYAKLNGCSLQLHVSGKYGPVMANHRAVTSALTSLGISFIEASPATRRKKMPVISLAIRRNSSGVSAGVLSDSPALTGSLLERARQLKGLARQPFAGFDGSPGAGIYVADELFARIGLVLRPSSLKGRSGLAVTMPLSSQLSLV